jgi:hypothetical protein
MIVCRTSDRSTEITPADERPGNSRGASASREPHPGEQGRPCNSTAPYPADEEGFDTFVGGAGI